MSYTADTLDVLTETEARDAVGDNGTPKATDDLLARWNTAVARKLDRICGPVVRRTITDELHDGGYPSIMLRNSPAASISGVTEYVMATATTLTAETIGTTPGTGFLAEPHATDPTLYSGRILRRSGGATVSFWPGARNIKVTYSAGRFATTATVDERFKSAAALMLKNAWRSVTPGVGKINEFDVPFANFPTFMVPNAVYELLEDEVYKIPGVA